MRRAWLLLALAPGVACDGDPRACYPGDFVQCECDDGQPGYAQCDVEGAAYGTCRYCGTTPGLVAGGAGGGELIAFMAPCEQDSECETNLCYAFAAKGPHCTQSCEDADDCPAPSPGCNGMGVCKAP